MNAAGSVEDLMRLGLARHDSESAFQEFLARIPSVSGMDTLMHQTPGSVAMHMQLAATLPRVSSWKQLGVVQPFAAAGAAAAAAREQQQHAAGAGLPVADLHVPPQPLATRPPVPSTSVTGRPAGAVEEHGMVAAANALNQFSQQLHSSGNGAGHSEGTSPSSNDREGGTDTRKARRMLSNRESARRSRKRKQEHLTKLEQEIGVMLEEKRTWSEKSASLERHCSSIDDENRRLKEENERLRDELQFLRSELSCFTRRRARQHVDEPVKQET